MGMVEGTESATIIELESEGGSGKTTLMEHATCEILDKKQRKNSKEIVPIYIPLKFAKEGIYAYIREKYLPNVDSQTNVTDLGSLLSNLEKNDDYLFVFLLDALNESNYDGLLDELSLIFNYAESSKNRSFVVIYSIRSSNGSIVTSVKSGLKNSNYLKTFECKSISNESVEYILTEKLPNNSEILKQFRYDAHTNEVLARPFYLSNFLKFVANAEQTHEMDECHNPEKTYEIDEFHIIDNLVEGMLNKITNIEKSKEAKEVFDEFVERCFEYRLCNKLSGIELSEREEKILVGNLALLVLEKSKYYTFRHENYLDYGFVKTIVNRIRCGQRAFEKPSKIKAEPLKMLSYALFDADFYQVHDWNLIETKLNLKNSSNSQIAFENLTLVLYAFLEGLDNGSAAKIQFCKSFVENANNIVDWLKIKMGNNQIVPSKTIGELLRIIVEIYRRASEFELALDTNDLSTRILGECKPSENEKRHNRAKILLYQGYEEIVRSYYCGVDMYCQDDDLDLFDSSKYEEGKDELWKLATQKNFTQSRNLYAMLTGAPIPPIDGSRNSKKAFDYNWQTVKNEYGNSNEYYYPLSQCYSSLIRGDVEIRLDSKIRFSGNVEIDFDRIVKNAIFVPSGENYKSNNVTRKAIEMLREKLGSERQSIIAIYGKYELLWNDSFDCAVDCAKKSSVVPLSRFILAIKYNDIGALDIIKKELIQKSRCRSIDAFDPIYIQDDLNVIWNYCCEKLSITCSDEFIDAIYRDDSVLNVNLRDGVTFVK